MAAGLSKAQIDGRVRRRLQAIAREHGGTYAKKVAERLTPGPDGLCWRARFSVSNMSNGETVGWPVYEVWAPGHEPRTYSGLEVNLAAALASYRGGLDGKARFVVIGPRTGYPRVRPTQDLTVKPEDLTANLGEARNLQLAFGNVPDVVEVIALDDPADPYRVRVVREVAYSGRESLDALDAFRAAKKAEGWVEGTQTSVHPAGQPFLPRD